MGLVVVSLVMAAGLSALLGGRLRRLAALRLRNWPLLAAAAAAQFAASLAAGFGFPQAYPGGLALSAALALAFLAGNRHLPGIAFVAGGLLVNAAAVAANGAMPVSRSAAAAAGVDLPAVAAGQDPRHEIAGPGTRLSVLGDVVPLRFPIRSEVASPGDLAVALGLAMLTVGGMRGIPRRRAHVRRPEENRTRCDTGR